MKKILFSVVIAMTMTATVGCSQSNKKTIKKESSENIVSVQKDEVTADIFGTYRGTFPCADCGGKDISLTISNDGTYCLKYKYQDKDEMTVEENGTYTILDDIIIETITPSSGNKTYYKYVNGNLVLSDKEGTVNEGELADFYVLIKE